MQLTWAKNRCTHISSAPLTFRHTEFFCLYLELRAQVETEAFVILHDTSQENVRRHN
jgi:hypothetical protein